MRRQSSGADQQVEGDLTRGGGQFRAGDHERRQLLPAQNGQQKGHRVERQVKQRRGKNQTEKETADKYLAALGAPLPQNQRDQSPNAVAERIEPEKQKSDG